MSVPTSHRRPSRTVRREAAVARSPSGNPIRPASRARFARPENASSSIANPTSETDGVRSVSTSNTSASRSTLTSRDEYTDSDAPLTTIRIVASRPSPRTVAAPPPVTQPGDTHSRNRRCGTQPTYGATTRQLEPCAGSSPTNACAYPCNAVSDCANACV